MESLESVASYKYTPLEGPDTIRLVSIRPSADKNAVLDCSIQECSLEILRNDLVENFTALSYVWGDNIDLRKICLDHKSISITASLDSALRQLRDADRVFRVWADALCINQKDPEEKTKQVKMMGSIYAAATHTVIFLEPSKKQETLYIPLRDVRIVYTSRGATSEEVSAVRRILACPWWSRVWILQELVLSIDPWIQCDNTRIRWASFVALLMAARPKLLEMPTSWQSTQPSRGGILLTVHDVISMALEMQVIRVRHWDRTNTTGKSLNLAKLLAMRRGLGATDPRDIVFAHLALITNSELNILNTVDYGASMGHVYSHATRYIDGEGLGLNGDFHYEFLSMVEDVNLERRHSELPTWCPDWSRFKGASYAHQPLSISQHSYQVDTAIASSSGAAPQRQPSFLSRPYKWLASRPMLCCTGFRIRVIDGSMLSPVLETRKLGLRGHRPDFKPNTNGTYQLDDGLYRHLFQSWRTSVGLELIDHNSDLERRSGQGVQGNSAILFKRENIAWSQKAFVHYAARLDQPESIIPNAHRIGGCRGAGPAILPYHAHANDVIVYLRGGRAMFVLRPLSEKSGPPVLSGIEDEARALLKDIANGSEENGIDAIDTAVDNMTIGHYKFVGECFVEDMMYGAAGERSKTNQLGPESIVLIH